MSERIQNNQNDGRPASAIDTVKSMLNRWGIIGKTDQPEVQARRPGATKPVWVESSPASVNPFPETKTMPGGWDLSEILKP
jgi:hypothetical protein